MNNHRKEIIGNSLSTIGTIQAAVGGTPQFHLHQNQNFQWRLTGNVLQALGSFTGLADEFFDSTEEGRAENIIGNLFQGIGNTMQALSGVQEILMVNKKRHSSLEGNVV